jgi:hypothetical protein
LIGDAVLSNERDRTYLLLGTAPFLGFFLFSFALRLAAWFSRPAVDLQAPLLPEFILQAAQLHCNASAGSGDDDPTGDNQRFGRVGVLGRSGRE